MMWGRRQSLAVEHGGRMFKRICTVAGLTAVLAAAGLPGAPASSAAAAPDLESLEQIPLDIREQAADLSMPIAVGETVPVPLAAPVRDVIVANPDVADVVVKSPTKVYILGRGPGATDMFFIDARGNVVLSAEVLVDLDLEAARRAIDELLPDARIELRAVGSSVVMSGWVRSAKDAADAQAVVEGFLDAPPASASAAGDGSGGEESGYGSVSEAAGIGGGGGAAGSSATTSGPKVVNALKIASDQQVLLQVRVAEIQRDTLKRLGVNTDLDIGGGVGALDGAGLPLLGTTPNLLGSQTGQRVTGNLNIQKWGLGGITFDTLETQGLVKVLAEPSLTAISGETANFLAGGEFPVATSFNAQSNTITFEYKPFGVVLSFTPVVLANEQLSLRISTEVSRKADENSVALPVAGGGVINLQGLSVRRAQSTVMLPSGGSLMIAGLLQDEEFDSFSGAPGLMNLPVLGALFRSHDFQQRRSELVVIVRAYMVRPIEFGADLALPTDGFKPASDYDIYVMGRLHGRYAKPGAQALSVAGPIGYIME